MGYKTIVFICIVVRFLCVVPLSTKSSSWEPLGQTIRAIWPSSLRHGHFWTKQGELNNQNETTIRGRSGRSLRWFSYIIRWWSTLPKHKGIKHADNFTSLIRVDPNHISDYQWMRVWMCVCVGTPFDVRLYICNETPRAQPIGKHHLEIYIFREWASSEWTNTFTRSWKCVIVMVLTHLAHLLGPIISIWCEKSFRLGTRWVLCSCHIVIRVGGRDWVFGYALFLDKHTNCVVN